MNLPHRFRSPLLFVAVASLILPAARAQATPPPVAAADLQEAARVALAQGVIFLKQRAAKDPEGWIIAPGRPNRISEWKEVVVRYREIEVDVPVYEYKQVVAFQQTSPGDPPEKVVVQRPVRQIGTKKEMRLRLDPTGPIERKEKRPVYESGGNTFWYASTVGDAALAVCALRRAGVPDSDPVIQRMLANFASYLSIYGPPDQTWNLAWLTTAMAQTKGKNAVTWTQTLAGRLLDGQLADGPARGLWGPMCVHPRLLSVLTGDYLAIAAEVAKREARVKKSDTKANEAALEEAKTARKRQQHLVEAWNRRGLRFGAVEQALIWEPNGDPVVTFSGSSDFFYNQRSADLESTWVALHALAITAENQRLPEQSLRPPPRQLPGSSSMVGAATVPPEGQIAVLGRAANTLVRLQPADGRWTECNFHQPVNDFDTFTSVLPVPVDPKSFPPLASPVTPLSAAQGFAAFDGIRRAVGAAKLPKFQRNLDAGLAGRWAGVESLIKEAWSAQARRPVLDATGYDLLLAIPDPLPSGWAGSPGAQLDDQLTQLLILAGNPAGGWATGTNRIFLPSSSRERFAALKDTPNRIWDGRNNSPVELNKAHAYRYNVSRSGSDYLRRDAEGFATAAAVFFLAGRVENPAAALLELEPDSQLKAHRQKVDRILLGLPPPQPEPATVSAVFPPAPSPNPAAPADETKPRPDGDAPVVPPKPGDSQPKKDESL